MEEFPSVVPVKLLLAFTRWSASTRKHERGERESIISVIPDMCIGNPSWPFSDGYPLQTAGMTLGILSVLAEISIVSDRVRQLKSKFLQKILADKSTFTFFPFYLPARLLCLPILPSIR
jgi:hypothetical protein